MPCALYSLVRTNCSDAHLLLGLCVIHLASWCPNRCFTRHPLVFHLAAGWHLPQKELFSCALSPSPALSPFPPTCGSQSVPAPTLCEGLCPGLRAPVLPLMLVYSLWLSAAQLGPQHPYRHRWVHAALSSRAGVGEQVCESPHFPLCPRCWLWALSRVAAEL